MQSVGEDTVKRLESIPKLIEHLSQNSGGSMAEFQENSEQNSRDSMARIPGTVYVIQKAANRKPVRSGFEIYVFCAITPPWLDLYV